MSSSDSFSAVPYQVLARKYRPRTFAGLIGQEALVRVLTNGIEQDRLPHGFILTGVRGVGKTTTARIIARALNCIGANGKGSPTPDPCGVCEHCTAIAEDRHIDVIEMDAASHTGVDDIREITEASRYKAVSARYKIYIIDEVHMLTKHAFNALLKTLEEPPLHVKFIFATTEINRVPDTILSRCMRFDLRRIDLPTLKTHLEKVTSSEGLTLEATALNLLARAADGSVRDALSLLDQAISISPGRITGDAVRKMLGLVDRGPLLALFKAALEGKTAEALSLFREQHEKGAEPLAILHELLDYTHALNLLKIDIKSEVSLGLSPEQIEESKSLAGQLSIPILTRFWQVLLKGVQELSLAPFAAQAVEMILIRLAHMSALPTPHEIIEALREEKKEEVKTDLLPLASKNTVKPEDLKTAPIQMPASFEELVKVVGEQREPLLYTQLKQDARLIKFAPGVLELFMDHVPGKDFPARLKGCLEKATGETWQVMLHEKDGGKAATLQEREDEKRARIREEILKDPLVQAAKEAFPEAEIDYIDDNPDET